MGLYFIFYYGVKLPQSAGPVSHSHLAKRAKQAGYATKYDDHESFIIYIPESYLCSGGASDFRIEDENQIVTMLWDRYDSETDTIIKEDSEYHTICQTSIDDFKRFLKKHNISAIPTWHRELDDTLYIH